MRMNPLGRTGLMVSELCLGTMTFGTQTSTDDAHAQIDMALDHGVNILDTAEMYPVNPLSADTQGDSERVVGEWVAASGKRDKILIATKVSGAGYKAVRDGAPISRATITAALDASLKNLQTDCIDLYQLHWPNRGSYMFRQNWSFDPSGQNTETTKAHIDEVLDTLQECVVQGKIRHFGLSNESAWGTAQWVQRSEVGKRPRVASIQNEYSLLCRLFDTDLAELCHHENVGLLAFSPLAAGLLSGKYQGGTIPKGSRRSFVDNMGGRMTPKVEPAVAAYLDIAAKHGLYLVHMALAWCRTRPFMASAIFGATTIDQCEHALGSVNMTLNDDVLAAITAAHRAHPMPY
jgi:aryl-alcohol dehydrogenase-like predicted oxidoreductase